MNAQRTVRGKSSAVKRTFLFLLVFESFFRTAAAQAPPTRAKLSPQLQMLLSGDPDQEALAKRLLPIKSGPGDAEPVISAFIRFQGDKEALRAALKPLGVRLQLTLSTIAIGDIPVRTLQAVADQANVVTISEGERIKAQSDKSVPETGANGPLGWGMPARPSPPPWTGNTGKNAIIGIVDSGIDLRHPDFKDWSNGKTRILALWDQTAKTVESPAKHGLADFTTGNDCTQQQIDAVTATPQLASVFGDPLDIPYPGLGLHLLTGPAIAVADFDRDGYQDIATSNGSLGISVFLGAPGGFSVGRVDSPVATSMISSLAVADFDGDGIPDLVGVSPDLNQIFIFLGTGNGTFVVLGAYPVGNGPTSVAVGDVNGDGFADLSVTNYFDSTVSVLLGDGKGLFTEVPGSPFAVSDMIPTYPVGMFPTGVAMADFNGDGKLDLAIANWGRLSFLGISPALSILLGNGDGSFKRATTFDTGHFGLALVVADFNRDGNPDVALQSYSHSITVLLGNGDGTLGGAHDYETGGTTGLYAGLTSLAVGDFNADGNPDLATLVNMDDPAISIGGFYNAISKLIGNGDGTFGNGIASTTARNGSSLSKNTSGLVAGNFGNIVCTEVDVDGHGTHVAGIAAGNGSATNVPSKNPAYRYIGMAPEAHLIIVKVDHSSTDNIATAVGYIEQKAAQINATLPLVINISQGTVLGPHDGSALLDVAMDQLTGPGQVIVAAAGNEGDTSRHVSGNLNNGQIKSVFFDVPAGLPGIAFDLWYPGADDIGVQMGSPCGNLPANAVYWSDGDHLNIPLNGCGTAMLTQLPNPTNGVANGDHGTHVHIDGPQPGLWWMTLFGSGCGTGDCVKPGQGSFDVWASSSCGPDNQCLGFEDGVPGYQVDPMKTLTSPATASTVIAVGSYATKNWWTGRNGPLGDLRVTLEDIAVSSSRGPTRQCNSGTNVGVPLCLSEVKPEITAPGDQITSSYAAGTASNHCRVESSFRSGYSGDCLDRDSLHVAAQGTSDAAPHASGAVALLLSQYGKLTVSQVKGALSNAKTDAFTGTVPNFTWGFGKLAIDRALLAQAHGAIVPNVIGLSQSDARLAITAAGFSVGAINRAPSSSPVNSVVSQAPAPGSILAQGAPVNLVLSGIPVPDVVGMGLASAQTALTGVLLKSGVITYQSSATIPLKQVISSDPVAGVFVTVNSTVDLVASGTIVPELIGQTLAAARGAIVAGHLAVGTITANSGSSRPVGSIDDQNPPADSIVAQGTPVALVVSGSLVPDVVGLPQAAAQSAVAAANLSVGTVSLALSITVPFGDVIGQTPSAGSILAAGAPVSLLVSQGPPANCPANVTSSVMITSTGFSYSVATKRYATIVTVANTSSATLVGPFALLFPTVSSGVSVYNLTNTTQQCAAPLGTPYITLPTGSLGPGAGTPGIVYFTNPSGGPITYTNSVFAGSGVP
jgi:beta-lactam-binding protein with PASTA domain/subtilisin family serine protease